MCALPRDAGTGSGRGAAGAADPGTRAAPRPVLRQG
eukprot:gene44049-62771_t